MKQRSETDDVHAGAARSLRVLYLGVGNPFQPKSGMDRVCVHHLWELTQEPRLEITAVVCVPGTEGQPAPGTYSAHGLPVTVYRGDLHEPMSALQLAWAKTRMLATRCVPLMAFSFYSRACGERLSRLLGESHYDLVVIDHFFALVNVAPRALARQRGRLVYIAHDSMFVLLSEVAAMRSSKIAAYAYRLEAARISAVEALLALRASCVLHLSEYERSKQWLRRNRRAALLPDFCRAKKVASQPSLSAPFAIFVGGTEHPPNAHAIGWICRELAPALMAVAPNVELRLIGKGTDSLRSTPPKNVVGLGFVSDDELVDLLSECVCVISPVEHGAGIKIKVLEAVAAGTPVLCSEHSLRGLEPLGLSPKIDLKAPGGTARQIKELSESPLARRRAQLDIEAAYQTFCATRRRGLARKLFQLHESGSAAAS